MTSLHTPKEGLKIVRDFEAPREMVFEAFSTGDAFSQWWGPSGMSMTVKRLDFQTGGSLHYRMEGAGQVMWGLFKYGRIIKPELIEFVSSFSNEVGEVCKSPFPMDFPLEIFNQVILTENNGVTTLTLQGHPVNATPEQETTYHSIMKNMEEGFGATFDQLVRYLAKARA